MKSFLILLSVLVLSACAEDKVLLRGSGLEIAPHQSAVELCKKHPELELCKGGK